MDIILLNLLILFILLAISAFFSASETAITAMSRAKVHKLKMEGNWRAKIIANLQHKKEQFISTILFGNNIINIAASAITTSFFIPLFGENGVLFATIFVTILVVIFAEVMPKTYAIYFPDRVSMALAPFINIVIRILAPITSTFEYAVSGLFRLLQISKQSENIVSGSDAIRGAIELGLEEGGVIKGERDMLGRVLDLSETEVHEVMIHRKHIDMLDANLPSEEMIEFVLSNLHSRIPVFRDSPDNIIGILHTKELLKLLRAEQQSLTVEDILKTLKKPWFIPQNTRLREQLNAFMKARNHLALVVDEYGILLGLVTLEDILEEIVGHIDDEHDSKSLVAKKEADGSYLIEGSATLRDLERELSWKLPDDNATTLAGLVIHEAQTIPDVGQVFEFLGFRFQILKKQKNQITLLRVKPLPKADASTD